MSRPKSSDDTILFEYITLEIHHLSCVLAVPLSSFNNIKVYNPFHFSWVPNRLELDPSQRTGVYLVLMSVRVGCFTE